MKELVEYIVKNLVNDEDAVSITETEENGEIVIHVNVAKEDMGRVIGKNGKIASGIRAIIKSISVRQNKKVFVKFGE